MIKWLNVNKCSLDVTAQTGVVRFLPQHEQELLLRSNTAVVVPLLALNRLTGFLIVTKKVNDNSYTPAEIQLLVSLSGHAAIAIEHALMYQFQEDKLKKLFHADKLTTVGELAAGAAHEIRNPLTSIRSTIQFLQKDLPENKKALANSIIDEVDRIDQIIKGLLSFSKSSELHITQLELDDIISQSLALLEAELRKNQIQVRKQFKISSPIIPGDASQLKQVFLNILLNSIQAMPQGGTISITTSDENKRDGPDKVIITIEDTGCGIPENILQKVFQPFFTTKDSGTGLGLSISYGIVSKHGGHIEIQSNTSPDEHGTTVRIELPKKVEHISQKKS